MRKNLAILSLLIYEKDVRSIVIAYGLVHADGWWPLLSEDEVVPFVFKIVRNKVQRTTAFILG